MHIHYINLTLIEEMLPPSEESTALTMGTTLKCGGSATKTTFGTHLQTAYSTLLHLGMLLVVSWFVV